IEIYPVEHIEIAPLRLWNEPRASATVTGVHIEPVRADALLPRPRRAGRQGRAIQHALVRRAPSSAAVGIGRGLPTTEVEKRVRFHAVWLAAKVRTDQRDLLT